MRRDERPLLGEKKKTSNNREIAVGESEQNLEADVGALDPLV